MMKHLLAVFAVLLTLIACSTNGPVQKDSAPTHHPANLNNIPDAVPKDEPKSRGGNPKSYQVFGKTYHVQPNSLGFIQRGVASWYGTKFHGRKTSNGETYDMYAMSAAHKTLPIPTYLQVTNLATRKQVIVRVNDRGPFHGNRIVDLSYAAASKLGILGKGTAFVEIKAINLKQYTPTNTPARPSGIPLAKPKTLTEEAIKLPTKTSTTTVRTGLYLQVGAFGDPDNAKKLKKQLLKHNISTHRINIKQNHDSALYRVHIGPYSSLEQADMVRIKLQQAGINNTHYMQY